MPRDAALDARLTAAEFELHKQIGPVRCTHDVGAELVVNAPDYSPLPSGAKVVVEGRDHGPPATYTVRFLGEADVTQGALSGAQSGKKDEVISGVLEKYLRSDNILTTARNCAGNQGVENILKSSLQFTVPLFQRKYCWQLPQWRTLWKDIRELAANPTHHMGKLAIYEEPSALVLDTARQQHEEAERDTEYQQYSAFSSARNGMSRAVQASQLMVIDGQQRLTTVCVILAALRDVAEMVAERQAGGAAAADLQAQAAALAATTNALLYREDEWFTKHKEAATPAASAAPQPQPQEDAEAVDLLEWFYSHASFLPTHDDRSSYAAAVLPRSIIPPNLGRPRRQTAVGTATAAAAAAATDAEAETESQQQLAAIFKWAAAGGGGEQAAAASTGTAAAAAAAATGTATATAVCVDREGFTKLLKLMGHIRPQDSMPEAPWLQLCARAGADPAVGLELAPFQQIIGEELGGGGGSGPVERLQAIAQLHMQTLYHSSAATVGAAASAEAEAEAEVEAGPSFILDCKDYYVEQAVRYVSSPTMDDATASAAITRLTELSVRVKKRLKFVFFELPSDASVQLFFEQLAMKEAFMRYLRKKHALFFLVVPSRCGKSHDHFAKTGSGHKRKQENTLKAAAAFPPRRSSNMMSEGAAGAKNGIFFWCFPYVCLEPVLAK